MHWHSTKRSRRRLSYGASRITVQYPQDEPIATDTGLLFRRFCSGSFECFYQVVLGHPAPGPAVWIYEGDGDHIVAGDGGGIGLNGDRAFLDGVGTAIQRDLERVALGRLEFAAPRLFALAGIRHADGLHPVHHDGKQFCDRAFIGQFLSLH